MRVLEPSSSPFSAYSSGRVRPPPNRSLRGYIEREFDVSRELLRKPREGQNVFGNAYNTVASASKNFWAFAGTPASLLAFALAFAGSPASLPAFALTFAGTPASPPASTLAFAGVPQVLRRTCWPLQLAINDILNKGISFVCRTHVVQHRYQAIQGQSVREKDTAPVTHALPHVRRSTQTDLHPDKMRTNPTKHLG